MRVRMMIDYEFYFDGINKRRIKAGEVVEVNDDVGRIWVREGKAREDKMMDGPPEVKVEESIKVDDIKIKLRKGGKKRGVE